MWVAETHSPLPAVLFWLETERQSIHLQQLYPDLCPSELKYLLQKTVDNMAKLPYNHTGISIVTKVFSTQ